MSLRFYRRCFTGSRFHSPREHPLLPNRPNTDCQGTGTASPNKEPSPSSRGDLTEGERHDSGLKAVSRCISSPEGRGFGAMEFDKTKRHPKLSALVCRAAGGAPGDWTLQ